jgi:integrase
VDLAYQRISSTDFSPKKTVDHFPLSRCKNVTSHGSSKITTVEKSLNTFPLYNSNRRVSAEEDEAKNLAKVKTRTENRAAGATKPDPATIKGKIIEYIWRLKNMGYADCTVEGYARILKILTYRGADLWNPESVKHTIRQQPWSIGRKANAVHAYTHFTEMQGLSWEPPNYRPPEKLPFIPSEKEINDLIAGSSYKIATFLRLLKETGMRSGEAFYLKWTDMDTVNNTVRVTPEKSSKPRIFKISNTLATMLDKLPKKSERIFDYRSKTSLRRTFEKQRKRIAHKLGNPRLLRIHFHTLRHWKATTEYRRTKDILHVMRLLGHKRIENTLKYVQLAEVQEDNEDFICKVATTMKQASELIETGFEYICTTPQDEMMFRKRKL